MEFSKNFYSALRNFCGKRGGQASLVKQAGIAQPVLSRILSGETKDPGLASVSALMDAMGYRFTESGLVGDCAEVRQQLAEARETITRLERELYQAQGEIRSLEAICDKAMDRLAGGSPPSGEKSYAPSARKLPEQDVG